MTQEQKDLLIKDLVGRLPYGVKIKTSYNKIDEPIELRFINPINGTFAIGNNSVLISDINFDTYECKPYLFPLSSMTEEQLKEMQEIIGNPNEACISVNTSGLELWLNSIDTDPTIWLDTIFEVQDWCNKNHFDYRGLIPMGLAIDATNLNIY